MLRESLARAGVPWEAAIPVMGSPEEGWRTRASLHLDQRGRDLRLGLHEEGTHRVVDLPRCLQLSEPMMRAARTLLEDAGEGARSMPHVQSPGRCASTARSWWWRWRPGWK